jgi:hypothetical protein
MISSVSLGVVNPNRCQEFFVGGASYAKSPAQLRILAV